MLSATQRRWLRGGLIVLAVTPAWVGVWALVAPHSFYASFPGAGHRWVSPLGPYNQHLVRDVGALQIGLLAILVAAAVTLERTLTIVALTADLVASTPHFVYHLTTTAHLSAVDNVFSLLGLAIGVVLPVALLAMMVRGAREPGTVRP